MVVALITSGVTLAGSILTFRGLCKSLEANQRKAQEDSINQLKKDLQGEITRLQTEQQNGLNEVRNSISEMKTAYQESTAITMLRLDTIEKKQDKHNSVIERTYKLETDTAVLADKIKSAHHRIDGLEVRTDDGK